ncbi:hypothetical protein BRADI_1g28605v3 [Brachypodium distachyon]|uniref:Uncharacterized protein n=1 Tax=Brachypodium distachyon TaxID=15368 RepID=A0A2K2DLP7_BRADI|nr:hypothetical protein BRADI_1g28605v3 [Brachypodium distachyon]
MQYWRLAAEYRDTNRGCRHTNTPVSSTAYLREQTR